ncbi:MAG TPA: hypothetical protein DD464_08405 [Bacteroides sp.]|nr:hypothetical protein [Bacteroides sp.]
MQVKLVCRKDVNHCTRQFVQLLAYGSNLFPTKIIKNNKIAFPFRNFLPLLAKDTIFASIFKNSHKMAKNSTCP